jgi:hypothetical protein
MNRFLWWNYSRLFRLESIVLGIQSVVDTASRCTTSNLLAGPACLRMPCCVCVYVILHLSQTVYIIFSWLELQLKVQKISHTWQICQASQEHPGQAKSSHTWWDIGRVYLAESASFFCLFPTVMWHSPMEWILFCSVSWRAHITAQNFWFVNGVGISIEKCKHPCSFGLFHF